MIVQQFDELRTLMVAHGRDFATAPVDASSVPEVTSALGLPEAFPELYRDTGPVAYGSVPWVAEPLHIYSFDELVTRQDGYRWFGGSRTPEPEWRPEWIVVADASADPFMADISQENLPVLFARHGAGTWMPVEVASSMPAFLDAVIAYERVLLERFAGEPFDADSEYVPGFLEAVGERLGQVLDPAQAAALLNALVE